MDTDREIIVISKHWHSPEIKVRVDAAGMEISTTLEDFVRALAAELPHPAKMLTRDRVTTQILAAIPKVLEKIKESSVHNPLPML